MCYYAVGMASLVFLTIVTCFIMQSFLPRKNIVNGQFTMLTSTLVLLAANCARASANAVSERVFYVEAAQIQDFCQIAAQVALAMAYVRWKRVGAVFGNVL